MKTYYQSSDGEMFYTEAAAKAHAKRLKDKKIRVVKQKAEAKAEKKQKVKITDN